MRNIKEGSENNPRFKMMEAGVTISDVAKGYGREVAEALVQFCKIRKLSIDEVVNDESEDRNGMTLWDKFDSWAQNRLGLDIMANYEQGDDWTVKGTKSDKNANEYDNPDQFMNEEIGREPVDECFFAEESLMNESSFEQMTMKDVFDAFSKNQNYDLEMADSENTIYVTNINDDQHYVLTIRHVD